LCGRSVAGLTPHNQVSVPNRILRKVALFGTQPQGKLLAAMVIREDVCRMNSVNELRDYISREDRNSQIDSVVIVIAPGDDLSGLPTIYNQSIDSHILVTVVIVTGKKCTYAQNTGTNAIIQRSSDIIIRTTDELYLQYMLECVLER